MSETNRGNSMVVFNAILDNKATVTADKIIEKIKNGEIAPAYMGVVTKKFEKIHELINKNKEAKELIAQDVKKWLEGNKKTVELYGAKITVANSGYWDYSTTNDPYLDSLKDIEKELKDLIKNREKEIQLKAEVWHKENNPHNIHNLGLGIRAFNLQYDRLPRLEWDEGIEVVETNPPVKISREQLRFSL